MTYDERLAWLDREVDKAFDALEGFLAERKGALAATNKIYEGLPEHLEKHRHRYELGLNDSLSMLKVERGEV